MSETVATFNLILGTGGIVMLFGSAFLLFDIIFQKRSLLSHIEKFGLQILAVMFFDAMVMAFIYSEVFGFIPCGLCWLMRITVFSQAVLLPFAVWKKDFGFALYGMVLSVIGTILGFYQHYLQMGGGELLPCPASGGDCAKRILFEYGFMTFPLMGAAMLLFAALVYSYLLNKGKSQTA